MAVMAKLLYAIGQTGKYMKTSRLLTYGLVGIIGGLLIENKALILKQLSKDKARKVKTKVNKAITH
jgi:hypothetical protein